MNPKNLFVLKIVGILLLVLIVVFYFLSNKEKETGPASNYLNAEYILAGEKIKLRNGKSEIESAPGSASKINTSYFGNEVSIDLDDDGREDKVFLLTQDMAGSGLFYYVVASLNTEEGYVGSEGLLLGDRIAPQTTELSQNPRHKNVIVVNYADRASGEPMTARPSVGKSAYLKLDTESMQWGIVEPNFEGEADPERMSLDMKAWEWISALYNDGREIHPGASGVFVLSFEGNGRFSAKTDCNSMSGSYTLDGSLISFQNIASTKMFCADSKETEFVQILTNASSYHFTSKGELILDLKFDSGSVVFK